jgi:hypothetical protein
MFQWPVEFAEMAASLLLRGKGRETGMMPRAQRGAESPVSSNMSVYQVRPQTAALVHWIPGQDCRPAPCSRAMK